jgi:hypothetical protein
MCLKTWASSGKGREYYGEDDTLVARSFDHDFSYHLSENNGTNISF